MEQVKLTWPNSKSKKVIVGPQHYRSSIGFCSRHTQVSPAQVYKLVGNSALAEKQYEKISQLENNVPDRVEEKNQESVATPQTEKEIAAEEGPVKRQAASAASGSGVNDEGQQPAKKPRSLFSKSNLTKVVQQ